MLIVLFKAFLAYLVSSLCLLVFFHVNVHSCILCNFDVHSFNSNFVSSYLS